MPISAVKNYSARHDVEKNNDYAADLEFDSDNSTDLSVQ